MLSNVPTEEDDEEYTPSIIRKRATTTTTTDRHANIFSSMITVPEESTEQQQQQQVAIESVPMANNYSKETGSKGSSASVLDDSIRSGRTENSLVNKMKDVLNEEWWAGTGASVSAGGKSTFSSGAGHDVGSPPIQTLLLSDQQQTATAATTTRKKTKSKKSRTNKADFIFGMVLLAVGFVVGGVFIHRDKVLLNMTSLLNSGTHSSKKSQQQPQGGGMRQLPIVQHQVTYEERQRLYREQKQAGNLRPINGRDSGQRLGVDNVERMRFQQRVSGV